MNLNEFAKEIHANSVAHGWWDEPRPFDELCALMISELSEALEEARAGRPMEWYGCSMEFIGNGMCEGGKCDFQKGEPCIAKGRKPEGIAVEMADCAIRILDYLGSEFFDVDGCSELDYIKDSCYEELSAAFVVTASHICDAYHFYCSSCVIHACEILASALSVILAWFKTNNLDFEAIARRKHEYNKTRPYKLHFSRELRCFWVR